VRYVLLVLFGAATLNAGQADRFEVASVKQNVSGSTRSSIRVPPAGAVTFTNVALRILIRNAYQLDPSTERFTLIAGPFAQMIGAAPGTQPREVLRFDVQGKPPEGSGPADRRTMLRALLEERFNLRAHWEMREIPVYALTVARPGRIGPHLNPSTFDCQAYLAQRRSGWTVAEEPVDSAGNSWCQVSGLSTNGPARIRTAGRLRRLAQLVQGYVGDRPVIDATGLSGSYEWILTFGWGPTASLDVPDVFTALREELGLQLVSTRSQMNVLVIDHIERPSEN
jgi:uncharacterized protein (TIGR03435 family)